MNSFKIKDSFLYDYQGTEQDIVIPEGVTGICEEAFAGCTALEKVVIPASVKKIGRFAFAGCSGLIVHAPKGSFAEKYAKENDIPFESI